MEREREPLREELQNELIEGRNAVIEALRAGRAIDKIFLARGDVDKTLGHIASKARDKGIVVVECDRRKLDFMSRTKAHQGVIALAAVRAYCEVADILAIAEERGEAPFVILCDEISDPHNLGAILRTAEAAGVDAVIVCDPLTDLYNPNLIRASIGGVFSVPVAVGTSEECIAFLKEQNISILTAQLQDSYPYYDYDMSGPTAIVMGTESTGLTQQWREAADAHIRIPMLGRLDSLNVSVSAAILIYEAVRQRQGDKETY